MDVNLNKNMLFVPICCKICGPCYKIRYDLICNLRVVLMKCRRFGIASALSRLFITVSCELNTKRIASEQRIRLSNNCLALQTSSSLERLGRSNLKVSYTKNFRGWCSERFPGKSFVTEQCL